MLKKSFLAVVCALLLSCGYNTTNPVQMQDFRDTNKPKKHLIVLLSGRGAPYDYFERQQWADIASQYSQDYDFVAPYLHYGYYMKGEVLTRLHEDVILPAKARGYKTISLAGISMGGLGCLLYSTKYPDDIDRIFLFAPFLGNNAVQEQIRADGGLEKWHLRDEDADDWNFYIWKRLQELAIEPQNKGKLYLNYGDKDRLRGHDLLAATLPISHVIKIPGNHDDVTFTRLWRAMLEQGGLKR
jgi:pimeloyl-ACP methyl ester carboxylesterase